MKYLQVLRAQGDYRVNQGLKDGQVHQGLRVMLVLQQGQENQGCQGTLE